MRVRSKRYKKESEQAGKETLSLAAAVEKVKSFKSVKFDQTVECVMQLGIDPKQADQLIRGSISLPNGIGKQKRVIAFCEDSDIEAAIKAGALEAGCDELVKKISDGWADFDVAIASPKGMGNVGTGVARLLLDHGDRTPCRSRWVDSARDRSCLARQSEPTQLGTRTGL